MRIALLSLAVPWEDRPTNGLYNIAQCRAIKDLGHESAVFSCAPKLPKALTKLSKRAARQWNRPDTYRVDGVDIRTARVLFGYSRFVRETISPRVPSLIQQSFAWAAKEQLVGMLDEYHPDALFIHGMFPWGRFAIGYAESREIPIVAIEHSQSDLNMASRNHAYQRSYRSNANRCDHVFTVSDRMRKQLREIGIERVSTILNGIEQFDTQPAPDTPEELDKPYRENNDWFDVLVTGQYIERKGHRFVLEAITDPRLSRVRVSLVGEPTPKIKHLIHKLDLRDRVRILPTLTQAQLREQMSIADLFVLPSWGEAFGLVYLESISAGTPVVLCDDSGAWELECVQNAGRVVAPKSTTAIANAIDAVMNQDKKELAIQVRHASRWIQCHATWQRNAQVLTDSVDTLITQNNTQSSVGSDGINHTTPLTTSMG